ncbi:hypothetical protein CC80DRAFT_548844 [Byssothecium circinans]|uniref:Uncharacterized protein n=1 Tax=Byssothecium circinans TaxID=147558 RepID=A0A6A5TSZ4_9PLEO|nr:hypothetical protein CC80DRAFT_548844 [Byssothecium circinans]
MARGTPSEAEVADTLSHLKLSTTTPQKPAAKPKSAPVAESWEDDVGGSDTETEESPALSNTLSRSSTKERDSLSPISTVSSTVDPPCPPPPTPASPIPFEYPDSVPYGVSGVNGGVRGRGGSESAGGGLEKRPEKTTAVAGRLIAGALGVRAPKRTDEEREYDRVMREKERKRRDDERNRKKMEEQVAEERKRAVWED